MGKTSTDQAIRTATAGVVLAVGGFAAAVSYSHIYDLARQHGQNVTDARLLPLSVDGLIIAASFVLLHEARAGRAEAPKLARWMLSIGVAATVGANIAYGAHGGPYDALVSAWPAVSFLGCAEMLMYLLRVSRTRRVPATRPAAVPGAVPLPRLAAVPARAEAVPGQRSLQDEFATEIAAGRLPGIKLIQRRMGGSQDTAYKHQAALRALMATA